MLILLTCVSLSFTSIPYNPPAFAPTDTVRSEDGDSLSKKDTGLTRIRPSIHEERSLSIARPFSGPTENQRYLPGALDSLFKVNPQLRSPLLKELIIPSKRLGEYGAPSALDLLNAELEQCGKLTPFERMSLITKRYATLNANDNSLKSYQLDIIDTFLWLQSVFK